MGESKREESSNRSEDPSGVSVLFSDEIPPEDLWATYDLIKNDGVIESFKVPFTQPELDILLFLREKELDPDLMDGYAAGGPERRHQEDLDIPRDHDLEDRVRVIEMLRKAAQTADEILQHGKFSPHLKSREAIKAIGDILKPLLPPAEKG